MTHHAELPLWDDKSSEQKIIAMRQMVDDLYTFTLATARQNLLKILTKAAKVFPPDEKEQHDIAKMQDLIQQYPNIMSPTCAIGHITGSGLVCDPAGNMLLHRHKKLNKWLQFGGHIEGELDVAETALREAKEESGLKDVYHYPIIDQPKPIDFDIHVIPESNNRPEHLHLDFRYMLMTRDADRLNPIYDESQDFLWAHYRDILGTQDPEEQKLIDPALRRLIQKCSQRFIKATEYTY